MDPRTPREQFTATALAAFNDRDFPPDGPCDRGGEALCECPRPETFILVPQEFVPEGGVRCPVHGRIDRPLTDFPGLIG